MRVTSTSALDESEIPPEDGFEHLLYARGFLLTRRSVRPPVRHWRRARLGRYTLSYDPRTPFCLVERGDTWVALLGRAIDLETWACDLESVARVLLKARLKGHDALVERLDMLSGRYAVFDGDDQSLTVASDAAGMRAIFYAADAAAQCAGSHAELVARQIDAKPHPEFSDPAELRKRLSAYALPGRMTAFAGVVALTPNTELEPDSGKVTRCFPRGSQEQLSLAEVTERLGTLLPEQAARLTAREPVILSLTAGLDSRTTLAMTRAVTDDIHYFTYETVMSRRSPESSEARDVAVSRQLAERFGLKHSTIKLRARFAEEPLRTIMSRNSARYSYPAIGSTHLESGNPRGVHLRSNLYEIGRAFFRSKRGRIETVNAVEMARMLTGQRNQDPTLVDAFEEYIEATDFDRGQSECDPFDLYYWEHRCGVWLNAHLAESDIAYDTFTLVNSRHILRLLLSVPTEDRVNSRVFLNLIDRQWPELLEVPVNGELRSAQ